MASNFPSSLDSFTNPSSTDAMDSVSVPHATQHSDLNDAVEALQAKVGADSSGVASSHDYKIAQLEAISHGKILQVVQTEKTDSFSTTSTSFVDVTGVSVSITPSSASNKVLILLSGIGGINTTTQVSMFNLVRDSTNIAQSTGAALYNETFIVFGTSIGSDSFSVTYLDSPATTSSTTYKLQMAVTGGTGSVGRKADNDNFRGVTTITALEVGA